MPRWPVGYKPGLYRICPNASAKACRKCATWKKPLLGKQGENHPCWTGGRFVTADGYVMVSCHSHPWPRKGGLIREHVMVMERHIGRRLGQNELVHHKDGNKQNNAIENLELMTFDAHSKLHRSFDAHTYSRGKDGKYARKEVSNAC